MQGNIETKEKGAESVEITAKDRTCLMCSNRFESDGPHHRICPKCKSTEAWRRG